MKLRNISLALLLVVILLCLAACGECQHDFQQTGTTAASCTAEGSTNYACSKCGETKSEPIAMTNHSYNNGTVTKEATCTAEGEKTITCITCGDSYTEAVAKKDHAYDDGVITTEPTCTAEGVKSFTCADCGDTKTEAVAMVAHTYTEQVTAWPTCTTEGMKTFTCSCGNTYTEAISMTAHNYDGGKVTTEPTCTAEGVKTFTCSCGASYTEAVAKIAHSYDKGKITKEATCDKDGVKTFTCSGCADSYTETVNATGHSYDKGKVTKEATCDKDGVKTFTCGNCKDTYTEKVSATGHSYTSASCTKDGACSKCGDVKDKALGHNWQDATCEEPKTCKRCNATEGSALGHNYKGLSCTSDGRCETCRKTVSASGHNYVSGSCTNCGMSDPNKVYSIGETWVVDGMWEFTVNSVTVHNLCNSYSNSQHGYGNQMVVVIDYTYRNLGYENTIQNLYMSSMDIDVYDGEGESASTYACTHDKGAKPIIVGTKCNATQAYILSNKSTSITLTVEHSECKIVGGKNDYGEKRSATFVLDIGGLSSGSGNSGSSGSGGVSGAESWSSSAMDDLLDNTLSANAFADTSRVFAESSLAGTTDVFQQGDAGTATRFANEAKKYLSTALSVAKRNPPIYLSGYQYSTVQEALQAAYDLIAPVSGRAINASNWRSVSTGIKEAATTVEAITMYLLNTLDAWGK